jgi:hypothetical protein
MTRAHASHAAWKNLAALLHKLGKNVGTFVVDQIDLFDTELADFLFAEKLALAARASTRTATGAAGATFTTSSATTGTAFATSSATMSAMSTTGTTFAAGRGSGRRCGCRRLRCCWCLILFV